MADNERQQPVRPQTQVPGQGPMQAPMPGPIQGPAPVPGPGMMPWGAPGPGGPVGPLPPQGGQQFPQGGSQRGPQPATPLPPGGSEQGSPQQMPQRPQRRPGYIDPNWKPNGLTMHDRLLELVQRYMDSTLQDARGIQGMMMRDGANRMYPRIEATIRGMSEEELKSEIAAIQSQMRKVLGEKEASAKQPAKKRRKTRVPARKQVRR
ncbi:hypothetical protein [Alicyclobacillus ferrooxydans]|uniref:Uncharacterized protein n=1 Tax=Alicyclobacillus ferrooxydans TaxID=471514 RepID=A0A0N8PNT5_9BACL|nr:hypothetical protein [Alicyclobacillus ferrooxydans]KPV42421.1 hypothetical protein AN477_17645 [Alicyclobacillus ferrooxydans]